MDASSVTQEQVNIVVNEFGKIHIDSAKETFGTITKSNNRKKKRNTKIQKPWFDLDCKFERQYYRKMKRKHKFRNSDNSRKELKEAEKKYKKQMDTSIRKYRQKMKKELKTLRSKNPKEYWKILNEGQKKKQPNISIDVLYEFFKNLNGAPDHDDVELSVLSESLQENLDFDNLNIHLNDSITRDEILTCIKKLKNDKVSGDDMIRNEFIKSTPDMFLALYVDLFNLIFNSGKIPNTWLAGNIVPFYKNKGAKTDPKNFRPITILSCFGKLFTSVLNNRLNTFSDEFLLLNENQTGFRKKYSTLDNTFVIYGLFELLKLKKKKLFCAFIDFEKAFDNVWRDGLWYKLLMCNIKGKMYNVILNLYNNIKSRIVCNDSVSNVFPCLNGDRQGEYLSPFLFALYLNDLDTFLTSKNAMYDILNKGRVHNLSVSCHLDLFDKIIIPMLTYGSEIWGYENIDILEKVHVQFCKLLLNLKTSTPNFMLYGELGRYPLNITVKLNILSFWSKLIDGKQSKLSSLIYRLLYFKTHGNNTFSWINFVKSILDDCGY